jgi:CRP/FNR family cyclic AMP-dependent transcriptional regulator
LRVSESVAFGHGWPYKPTPPRSRRLSGEELARREQALARAPLFSNLPRRHLRALAKITGVRSYDQGATIVREGSTGSAFFVILDGGARVTRNRRTLDQLSPGDFFGEISLLDPGPRTASVISTAPTVCLDLAGKDFRDILHREPVLAVRLLEGLGKRLRNMAGPAGE